VQENEFTPPVRAVQIPQENAREIAPASYLSDEEIYHRVSEAQDTVEDSLPELHICDPAKFCVHRLT